MKNGMYKAGEYNAWYREGALHREDGPAIEWHDGSKAWLLNNEYHREDGPAKEMSDGYKAWYTNGKLHRENGPAVEHKGGYKAWYINGELHRENGPAIVWADGPRAWYVHGVQKTEAQLNDLYPSHTTALPRTEAESPKRTESAFRSISRIVANMLHLRSKDSTPTDTKKPSV